MNLQQKIQKMVQIEDERIAALKQLIEGHKRKKAYYQDMLKIAGSLEADEQ